MDKNLIQQRMRHFRHNLDLTQKEISKIIGIPPETYQMYEYGSVEPKISRALRIADALHTTPKAIWG